MTEQTVVSAQPVVVTPVSSQPVETTVAGPATLESAVVADLTSNPNYILLAVGVVLVFGLVIFGWSVYEWVATGNMRAGAIVTGVASPLGVALAYVLGLITTPPKAISK